MAVLTNTVPLTVQNILDQAQFAYEQGTDTPLLTDDDGKIRIGIINKGIARWEFEDGVRWRELYLFNQKGSAITANNQAYPFAPTDFRELGGRIRFLRSDGSRFYIATVDQSRYAQHITENLQVAMVSGNPAIGYQLNLGWVPQANDGTTGAVPYYDYYKYANYMNAVTDVPEMSNPWYLVDYLTAELFANDDVNLYEKFSSDASAKLSNMREENESLPSYSSAATEDQVGDNTYAFGT